MKRRTLALGIVVVLVLLASITIIAIAADCYSISWWTVDSGGGNSVGDVYTLSGTIGQPDAGAQLSGGDFTLQGGFWASSSGTTKNYLYLPVLSRKTSQP